jgi:hypothetical protein
MSAIITAKLEADCLVGFLIPFTPKGKAIVTVHSDALVVMPCGGFVNAGLEARGQMTILSATQAEVA